VQAGIQPERAPAGSGPRKQPRITNRIPASAYARTNRKLLLQSLHDELVRYGYRYGGMQAPSRILDVKKIQARLHQTMFALMLNSPDGAATRDLRQFLEFMDTLPANPPGTNFFIHHRNAIMRALMKLGKQALFIISVQIGVVPRQIEHQREDSQHARMRPGGGR
jgi:hypothetical protein